MLTNGTLSPSFSGLLTLRVSILKEMGYALTLLRYVFAFNAKLSTNFQRILDPSKVVSKATINPLKGLLSKDASFLPTCAAW